jgi:HflK protein
MSERPVESVGPKRIPSVVLAASLWITLLLGAAFAIAVGTGGYFSNVLLSGAPAFLLWSLTVALIEHLFLRLENRDALEAAVLPKSRLSVFARRWQWIFVLLTLGFIVKEAVGYRDWKPLSARNLEALRYAATAYLAGGCVLYFFINFARAAEERTGTSRLNSVLILFRITLLLCFAIAGVLFLYLSTSWDLSAWLGWPTLVFALILAFEPIVRQGGRFYQPKTLRTPPAPASHSVIIDALWGPGQELKLSREYFESLLGLKVSEMWVLRFLRETGPLVVGGAVLLGWFSTAFTAVPTGSKGVLVHFGRFAAEPLSPGLHIALPWPFDEIRVVQTDRVREISLGFDRDLNGPVLWSERHVEGERNLLVGDGEALLTINVPILYRINDPVAYLQNIADPEQALSDLAERKLLHIMGSRESFSVMVDDRAKIAELLQTDLQRELTAFHFGIEVIFVGLQDVHPPVEVAEAYQEVVSAQEQKEARIHRALAKRAAELPSAQAQATKLRSQAGANYVERVSQAEGAATSFLALESVDREMPNLLRTQLRLDAIEKSLAKPSKMLIGISADRKEDLYLDLRNSSEISTP